MEKAQVIERFDECRDPLSWPAVCRISNRPTLSRVDELHIPYVVNRLDLKDRERRPLHRR